MTSILPPNSTKLESTVDRMIAARLADVPVAIGTLWDPATCPVALLPWLAWGLSLDLWKADWTEAQKRAAVADAIRFQQRKGTPASLRDVLDRFDPMIGLVEWFQDRDIMAPYTFRLELPLLADSDVVYSDDLVEEILRDIAQVKPVRAHFTAIYRLVAQARAWLLSAAAVAGQARQMAIADQHEATLPIWDTYLQTEDGEPLLDESARYLEH